MSGKNDPNSPDYQPEYTGETDDGDVGSGDEFGVSLYRLYAAGRIHLPAAATTYSSASSSIHAVQPYLARMIAAGATDLQPLVATRDDLQVAMVKTTQNLTKAGEELVAIANDYVRTDEGATTNFNTWRNQLAPPHERAALDEPTPDVPAPTRNDAPHKDLGGYPHGSLDEQDN